MVLRATHWSSVITWSLLVCTRASLNARSFASLPEFTKKQTLNGSGSSEVNFLAHRTRLSCRNLLLVLRRASCVHAAFTTAGWQWPTVSRGILSRSTNVLNQLNVPSLVLISNLFSYKYGDWISCFKFRFIKKSYIKEAIIYYARAKLCRVKFSNG